MTQVYEVVDSMSGSISMEGDAANVEVRRRFVIGQCDSFVDCVNQITPYAPAYSLEGGGTYWVRSNLAVQGIGNRYFDVTATYRALATMSDFGGDGGGGGDGGSDAINSFSWDTSGNTELMTEAYSQERYPPTAADFEGAINASGDSVEGVNVVRPCLRYTETWIMPAAAVRSEDFISNVYKLTGTVNATMFRFFKPGEVLFMGARGQWHDGAPYIPITFEFEARPNEEEWYPFQGANTTDTKEGWEHVWLRYEGRQEGDSLIQRPIAAYKSVVYKKMNWSGLRIGSGPVSSPRAGLRGQEGNRTGAGLGQ